MKKSLVALFFLSINNILLKGQSPINLKYEHLESPIGIDNPAPHLSWKIQDGRQGAKQTAYRLIVGAGSLAVLNDNGNMWDTGKTASGDILITYRGKENKYLNRETGIFPDPEQPGFKYIILRPNFVDRLEKFEAQYDSPYGKIVSVWKRKKRNITYDVTIPANSTATLYLPESLMKLEAGKYAINLKAAKRL